MNHQFQLLRNHMDKKMVLQLQGYDADDDVAGDDYSVSTGEYKESALKRRCHPSPLMRIPSRRKRGRQERLSKRPRLSIVNSEIDFNLTTHIIARRQQEQLGQPTTREEMSCSLHALAHMLEDYFHRQHVDYKAPAASGSDQDHLSPEQANTEFSRLGKYLYLEEALEFSSDARMLIDASPSHCVIHANAAFCRLVVENEPSRKKASAMTRVQERFCMPSSSLESVVSTMFADRPVTLYPVQDSDGSGVIRYYLAEHVAASAADEPAQTVG
jgi:hypothetical protein